MIVVDNLGRSCPIFIGLLDDQTIGSFVWALETFRDNLTQMPTVIRSDEDDAILSGKILFCWLTNFKLSSRYFPPAKVSFALGMRNKISKKEIYI